MFLGDTLGFKAEKKRMKIEESSSVEHKFTTSFIYSLSIPLEN